MEEDIHVKTREALQNTDLDMQQFLGIDKALQSIKQNLEKVLNKYHLWQKEFVPYFVNRV